MTAAKAGRTRTRRIKVDGPITDVDLDQEDYTQADGSRLDEAAAAEIAREVLEEAGRTRPVGRPTLSGTSTRSPQLGVRVSQEVHARLLERADDEGKRVSDIVRDAIEAYL